MIDHKMSDINFTFNSEATASLETFNKTGSAEGLTFIQAKDQNNRPWRIDLECEDLGDLLISDYGHSVLCRVDSNNALKVFENVEDVAVACLPEAIDFKPFIKDEKFFLKLPFKNDKYRATIDPSFLPSKPEQAPFYQGARLKVEATISMWINFSSATAGLFLTVNKITVDGGKKRTVKRR